MNFLADENFNNDILRGVWRRLPTASFTRVQDSEIAGADDTRVLAYAAEQGYLVLTHDVNTLLGVFYDRVMAALPVPGVFLVPKHIPVGHMVDELELIILASEPSEWDGKITYLPYRVVAWVEDRFVANGVEIEIRRARPSVCHLPEQWIC